MAVLGKELHVNKKEGTEEDCYSQKVWIKDRKKWKYTDVIKKIA